MRGGISSRFWFAFPEWLMMVNIFLCAYCPFIYLVWRNVCSILCLFLNWVVFYCCWIVGILYIVWILTSYQIYDLQIFSAVPWVAFSIVNMSFFVYSISPFLGNDHTPGLSLSQSAYSILFATIIYLPKDRYRTKTWLMEAHPKTFLQICCGRCTVLLR